jgi:hypothetical protein
MFLPPNGIRNGAWNFSEGFMDVESVEGRIATCRYDFEWDCYSRGDFRVSKEAAFNGESDACVLLSEVPLEEIEAFKKSDAYAQVKERYRLMREEYKRERKERKKMLKAAKRKSI